MFKNVGACLVVFNDREGCVLSKNTKGSSNVETDQSIPACANSSKISKRAMLCSDIITFKNVVACFVVFNDREGCDLSDNTKGSSKVETDQSFPASANASKSSK